MGREYSSDVDMSLPAQGNRQSSLPLVEVRDDSLVEVIGDELTVQRWNELKIEKKAGKCARTSPKNHATR